MTSALIRNAYELFTRSALLSNVCGVITVAYVAYVAYIASNGSHGGRGYLGEGHSPSPRAAERVLCRCECPAPAAAECSPCICDAAKHDESSKTLEGGGAAEMFAQGNASLSAPPPAFDYTRISPGVALPKGFDVRAACPGVRMESQYNAQNDRFMADVWLREHFKVGGVFVEIGANDGVQFSNSLWLERCLGWRGLLIEGHPGTAELCRKNRGRCIQQALCDVGAPGGTVQFTDEPGGVLAADVASLRAGGKPRNVPVIDVPCKRFRDILAAERVTHVDFWSLDVEGAELLALRTHDWERVPVHFLLIENAKRRGENRERFEFLASKCMREVSRSKWKWQDNTGWFNPWFPLPACQGKELQARGALPRP